MVGLASTSLGVSTPVSAAAESCSAKYTSTPVASDAEKAQQVELRKACDKGYETDSCNNVQASKNATKKERKAACEHGRKYRAENPPPPAEEGSGTILDEPSGDGCGGVDTAIIKCDQNNSGTDVENNGIWGLLLIVINVLTAGVGVLAVGGIVYAAVLYTTAEDKADQVKKSTDVITNVVIGLVAFALMWAGLNFLIPGGVFA